MASSLELRGKRQAGGMDVNRKGLYYSGSLRSSSEKRTCLDDEYKDHFNDPVHHTENNGSGPENSCKRRGPRGGVLVPFPDRLYDMLAQAHVQGFEDIVSWQPHGRAFIVRNAGRFVDEVLPK